MSLLKVLCAWCIDEQGEKPASSDSHGICDDHAENLLIESKWKRLQNTASYVERFKDGLEQWEDTEE